ncbi:hypothetical protein FF100_04925 [Methylobacterium terricola]|uniref:Uncharacterized protein n=1 Tax=Methylobacterium terricola TaxID=2583531 RepID=A0A5C4LN90_9HYPH|nr:hypothetical protein [Methylobacterium terricola]TNC14921.1 hypothetical protein FF100_04925 [Methylobacterium terricola]
MRKFLVTVAGIFFIIYTVSAFFDGSGAKNQNNYVFVSSSNSYPSHNAKFHEFRSAASTAVGQNWIFPTDKIELICSSQLRIIRVGEKFAALNGHTSGAVHTYKIKDNNGDLQNILRTDIYDSWRGNGIVKIFSDDGDVNKWRSELNTRLGEKCG